MKKLFCALAVTFLTFAAHAANITALGRSYSSCSYFTVVQGDAEVTFVDQDLPWGSRVFLVSGVGGVESIFANGDYVSRPLEWRERTEIEMKATAPYTWSATRTVALAERGRNAHYDHLQFVVRVELPTGENFYDNGNQSRWGYYQTYFPERVCAENEPPAFLPLTLSVINR